MNYNPYDLVPLLINGKTFSGRPVEFDSDVANQMQMTNASGEYVKPTKLTATCPDCGQLLMIDVVLGNPPFGPVEHTCEHCHPAPPPLPDPFINPIDSGRVSITELDPLYKDPATLRPEGKTTVADRVKKPKAKRKVEAGGLILTPVQDEPVVQAPIPASDDLGVEQDFEDLAGSSE